MDQCHADTLHAILILIKEHAGDGFSLVDLISAIIFRLYSYTRESPLSLSVFYPTPMGKRSDLIVKLGRFAESKDLAHGRLWTPQICSTASKALYSTSNVHLGIVLSENHEAPASRVPR